MLKSFKSANFSGKHPDAGVDQLLVELGFKRIKVWGLALLILSH